VIPNTVVPVQPVLLAGKSEYAMRKRYSWVLATHHYVSPEQLIADLGERGDRSCGGEGSGVAG
jgi:hypothetical protein